MARKTRTFVALDVAEAQGQKLAHLQELLAPDLAGLRLTTRPFHLTLAFLGDVDDTALNDVCRAAATAAAGFAPFELRLEGLGVFPNPARPRTLWVGLTGPGLEPLAALQKEVARAVAGAGYPPDDDRFHPHVTLGRLKPGRGPGPDANPLLKHYRGWSAGSFRVAEAVTYASTLTPDGPLYAPLGTAPLLGRKDGLKT
jgi:2'-5' RNA ligase